MAKSSQILTAWVFCLVCTIVLGWAQPSAAQSIDLNRYSPAPAATDGFSVARPTQPGHLRFGAQLQLDYAREPLVWRRNADDEARRIIVRNQLAAHLAASLGLFDRVLVSLQVPVNLVMNGDGFPDGSFPLDGASLGNLELGARVRALGEDKDIVAVGGYGELTVPTAKAANSDVSFAGTPSVGGKVGVLLELRFGLLRLGGNAGVRFRKSQTIADVDVDSDITYSVGAGYTVLEGDTAVIVLGELHGSTLFSKVFGRDESPFEWLVGAKLHRIEGFSVGIAGDAAISEGIGSPFYRLIGMLGWQQPSDNVTDRDNDGIVDALDTCPETAEDLDGFQDGDGCPDPDNDADGLPDGEDKCPSEAEDKDGFQDADGCPDPDNDADDVLDATDKCPGEAEDKDGFQDDDGCPDPDNDADGILDAHDKCPGEAEDKDGFQDDDGCPDPDNDGDGVPDAQDQCPLEAENKNGRDDEDGCPDLIRVDRAQNQIVIMEPVMFALNSDQVLEGSFEMLREMAEVIIAHPEIISVAIEGHTDSAGSAKKNMKLSGGRASSVRDFLIAGGVAENRLTAQGFGSSQPVADNKTAEGRAKNRRVDFKLNFGE